VLDGIPIGLSEFFALTPAAGSKVFWRADELVEIGKGRISYRQVGGSLAGRKLQILKESYEPGADTGRVMLSHDGEEGAIVTAGRLEVTVDGQKRILTAGEAYFFDSRLPHRFRNVGEEACELISACTPPTF
jgi:mannose-6-phosphate isomerase-like protein (cupin superfamily)